MSSWKNHEPARDHDRVPEVLVDVHVDPRLREVRPVDAVRPERERLAQRVLRRRDRRLREPEQRPESGDTRPTKRTTCTPPMPTLTPRLLRVGVRDDAAVGPVVASTSRSPTADDAAQAGRRVRGVDPFEDGRLGRRHEVLQRSVSLKYSQLSRREHDREHHAQRGRLAVVAAEAVLEGVAVDEQQHRDRRVVRTAAGEQERLEEHLRRRDDLQDQHDEDDAAQLRQRDVPDLAPDARRRRPRPRRRARAAR